MEFTISRIDNNNPSPAQLNSSPVKPVRSVDFPVFNLYNPKDKPLAGIGLNIDCKSRTVMMGWAILSGSVHKGAESTRVVATMCSRGTTCSADT